MIPGTPITVEFLPELFDVVTLVALVGGLVGACCCFALRALVLALYSYLTRRRRQQEWRDDLLNIAAELHALEASQRIDAIPVGSPR